MSGGTLGPRPVTAWYTPSTIRPERTKTAVGGSGGPGGSGGSGGPGGAPIRCRPPGCASPMPPWRTQADGTGNPAAAIAERYPAARPPSRTARPGPGDHRDPAVCRPDGVPGRGRPALPVGGRGCGPRRSPGTSHRDSPSATAPRNPRRAATGLYRKAASRRREDPGAGAACPARSVWFRRPGRTARHGHGPAVRPVPATVPAPAPAMAGRPPGTEPTARGPRRAPSANASPRTVRRCRGLRCGAPCRVSRSVAWRAPVSGPGRPRPGDQWDVGGADVLPAASGAGRPVGSAGR